MKRVDFAGTGRLAYTRQALTDLDCQILIRPDDLTPSAEQVLIGEFLTTGNKRGWSLRIKTSGVASYRFSNDGTASIVKDSTVTIGSAGYVDGDKFWLRVTHDVNNGAAGYDVKFYTSDDGVEWTQLGATVTTATATSIFSDAANVITMGGEGTAATYTGDFYKVRVYSVIGGSTNLVDPDPWDWSSATYGTSGYTIITPTLDATEQDVWPTRVLLTAGNLEAITDNPDVLTIYRQDASGERTLVRGIEDVTADDVNVVRVDAELPFGVPITYVLSLNDGEEEYTDGPMTVELVGGKIAITDAITGEAAEVVIHTWPQKVRARQGSVYAVGGRNVAVSGPRGGFSSVVEIVTETDSARENFDSLLQNATSGVLQLRRSVSNTAIDCYFYVTQDTENRFSADGSDERRFWDLDIVETEPWASTLEASGFTLQDIADAYTGQTLADLSSDFSTLLDIAQGDFGV
jgi:hypothetical protein